MSEKYRDPNSIGGLFNRTKQEAKDRAQRQFLGLTRHTNVPATEIERDPVLRFERNKIREAYTQLRKELDGLTVEAATQKRGEIDKFRERARVVERELDELNRQFYENVIRVSVETPNIGKHDLRLVELDLHKFRYPETISAEGGEQGQVEIEDKRIPYFFVGGIGTTAHQNAALSYALALEGHKVYAFTYPENEPNPSPDWNDRLKANRTYALHAEVVKEMIKERGLERVNLVGSSMGTGVVTEIAQDKDFDRINDLTLFEPVSIEDKGMPALSYDFFVKQGIKFVADKREMVKAFYQGMKDATLNMQDEAFITDGTIIAKKQFDEGSYANANVRGRFRIFFGSESPIVNSVLAEKMFYDADRMRAERTPDAAPIEVYKVIGADHSLPLVHAIGLADYMDNGEKVSRHSLVTIPKNRLASSAAEHILTEDRIESEDSR